MPDSANLPPQRVVVLGANGFIGQRVVRRLLDEPGMEPVALTRKPRRDTEAEVVACDATNAEGMQRALTGASYVVNCIAGSEATMVAATRVLCDTARRSGLKRLVHLSSMAVYGAATGRVDETTVATSPVSAYGGAKQACEQLVRAFITDGGGAVILRPGCVYGPGSEQWTGRIGRLLQAGRLGDLGADGDGVCNLTFVDDLVTAVVSSLRRPEAVGHTFNVAMADPPDWNGYLVRFARALGATPVKRISGRQLKLETKLLAPLLRIGAIGARASRISVRVPDAIPPSLASLFRQNIRLEAYKSVEVLNVRGTGLEWGLAASARWMAGHQRGKSAPPHDKLVEAHQ